MILFIEQETNIVNLIEQNFEKLLFYKKVKQNLLFNWEGNYFNVFSYF